MRTKRIIGFIVLGCVLASFAVLAGLIAWLGAATGIVVGPRHRRRRDRDVLRRGRPLAAAVGASEEEVRRSMPGDDLLRPGAPSTTRGDHDRRAAGGGLPMVAPDRLPRGGWYSYDWIDNDGKPSVDRIRDLMFAGMGAALLRDRRAHA
jgi:hypothetical protein